MADTLLLAWNRTLILVFAVSLFLPQIINTDVYSNNGLLPNLKTVIPQHLQIQNSHQQEILRFSNGIANVGSGNLQMIPDFPMDPNQLQGAIQQILDVNGNVVQEKLVSQFEFHEGHNHWHIADVAEFTIHKGSVGGPIVGSSVKVTFCLIDWYMLQGNSNSRDRVYFDCERGMQGIQSGWVDQYHQSIEGQQLVMTGAPPGTYYLVSTANPEEKFIESDYTDNTAWISFELSRDSKGNAKINVLDHSECQEGSGLCGEVSANR